MVQLFSLLENYFSDSYQILGNKCKPSSQSPSQGHVYSLWTTKMPVHVKLDMYTKQLLAKYKQMHYSVGQN